MTDTTSADRPRRRFGWVVAPLIVFSLLAAAFAFSLSHGDPSKLPSALIGKPAPQTSFEALAELRVAGQPVQGFTSGDLSGGGVKVVNFWASWCAPCVQEHPLLLALKQRTGVPIYGVNYKDKAVSARRFIGRYGNPYEKVGVDPTGRGAIEWGVYGMPETFVIDGNGRIAYKHVGPISEKSLVQDVIPAIEKARAASSK
ncbi:MAG: DsbE family thiol:disulfide interchange protein [Alphaproteobacteria bacterium]|nr:DsbE family thiol:disulfide interchange protein [Alphaproteobacteria bacterium]